jgi:putative ABC transport system permease protein
MVQLGWLSVGPGYLDALGTPLLLGREGHGAEAVITPSLAEELWPGESPIGRRISFAAFKGQVVGVAPIALGSVRLGDSSAVLSFEQADMLPRVVRNSSRVSLTIQCTAPAVVKPIALRLARQALPDATAIDVSTGEEILAVDIGRQRLASWFFSAYGVVAVLFALSGIYGLVSYVAHARQRDFCIMVALGAPNRTVILRALGGTIAPVLGGTVAGSFAAVLLSNVTQALLLNQSAADPLVFAGVGVAVVLASMTAGLAAAIPLRRMSPMTVLQPVA